MPVRKILGTAVESNTITSTQLTTTLSNQITNAYGQANAAYSAANTGGGPKVRSLIYPGNDTAANTIGGQTIYITGSGFAANAAIYINGSAVPSQSFISASNISFTTPNLASSTYPVYLINPEDGATAILIPGIIISGEPAWVTAAGSLSASQEETSAWSYSLSASGDTPITYALAAGNTLPTGVSLAANGLISGTITSPSGNTTTYTFSVVATDAQNQDSTRQFTVTTATGEGVLFANNVLLIHADGTNNQNNHHFLDSSNNNFTITRNGNATQGSFSPFSQTGWSNYFDGTGDYLSCSANAGFNIVSGDFTVEGWIYDQGNVAERYLFSNRGASTGWELRKNSTNLLQFFFTGGSSLTSATTITSNKWTHVAVTRSGNTVRIFLDGALDASTTFSNGASAAAEPFYLGYGTTGGGYFLGYISNARIVKGTAVYTSAFTPPTTALTAIANTQLLTCQSNRFIDNSTNVFTLTRNGDVSVQAFSPFAPTAAYSTTNVGGSVYIPAGQNGLTVGSVPAIGTGSFTVEGWFWPTTTGEFPSAWTTNVADFNGSSSVQGGVGTGVINFRYNGTGGFNITSGINLANQWNHIAWVRNGSAANVYLNGVSVGSGSFTNSLSAGNMYISRPDSSAFRYNGWISGFRILNTALYTSNFTPSTTAPTAVANTIALLNFTNAGIFDQTAKNVLETVGDAKVSTAQYKYGTASMYFDGSGDYIKGNQATSDLYVFRGDFTIEMWVKSGSTTSVGGAFPTIFATSTFNGTGLGIKIQGTGGAGTVGCACVWYNNSQILTGTNNIADNNWHHIAVTRNGSAIRLFVDGTQQSNTTSTASFTVASEYPIIGADTTSTGNLNGYIDDLRVTKGYARYTANFTPPTSALKDK